MTVIGVVMLWVPLIGDFHAGWTFCIRSHLRLPGALGYSYVPAWAIGSIRWDGWYGC